MGVAGHKRTPAELDWLCARVVQFRDGYGMKWSVIAVRLGYKDAKFVKKLYWRHREKEATRGPER